MKNAIALLLILGLPAVASADDPNYLKRSLGDLAPVETELSSDTAEYLAFFGVGDDDSSIVHGVERFAVLNVVPQGESARASFAREEIVAYVLSGTGMMQYGDTSVPISTDDFFYIPVGTEFSFSNPRERALEIAVMGYEIPADVEVAPTEELMLASSHEVPFQILGQHGPTTQFQLLMGTTRSRRDRLSAAYQMNSLFVMDFDVGGTNIPHRHNREEEIYFVQRGSGEMVAGETEDGEEIRYPAKQGDAFFIAKGTFVGFYADTQAGEEHARVLAVRSRYPQEPQ